MKKNRNDLLKELDAELTRAHALALAIVAHARRHTVQDPPN